MRLVFICPKTDFDEDFNFETFNMTFTNFGQPRLRDVRMLVAAVEDDGSPHATANNYLSHIAQRSRSATGDTVRTYAEALISWITFTRRQQIKLQDATEEFLAQYRNEMAAESHSDGREKYSRATVNLRVTVAERFHYWSQTKGGLTSPLGAYLLTRRMHVGPRMHGLQWRRNGDSLLLPVNERLPRSMTSEELTRFFLITPSPYKLMFRWAIATGLRRFEVFALRKSQLPTPDQIAMNDMKLVPINITRKGGRTKTVHAPAALVEETWWHIHFERTKAREPRFEDSVFLNRDGRPFVRQTVSRVFRQYANRVGSKATLHHLRHTFAISVLSILESIGKRGQPLNSIKTVQVLLGHSNVTTTEIYLRAIEVSSDEVRNALDFLYGATL